MLLSPTDSVKNIKTLSCNPIIYFTTFSQNRFISVLHTFHELKSSRAEKKELLNIRMQNFEFAKTVTIKPIEKLNYSLKSIKIAINN